MLDTLKTLLLRLYDRGLSNSGVIPWSSPIPVFGDLDAAAVATVGINPSNREFVDRFGRELDGTYRRFHTLTSLRLESWLEAKQSHLHRMWAACKMYFKRNPYDTWFRQLDGLLSGADVSYYSHASGVTHRACHLDVIPYATQCKCLLQVAGDTLCLLLRQANIRVLVLNGTSVVHRFEELADTRLVRSEMRQWDLPRRTASVRGIAYKGVLSHFDGVALKHDILVLGFNHNIQSSFGVTRGVKHAISRWISGNTARMLL
jgi:hypothetical protein